MPIDRVDTSQLYVMSNDIACTFFEMINILLPMIIILPTNEVYQIPFESSLGGTRIESCQCHFI